MRSTSFRSTWVIANGETSYDRFRLLAMCAIANPAFEPFGPSTVPPQFKDRAIVQRRRPTSGKQNNCSQTKDDDLVVLARTQRWRYCCFVINRNDYSWSALSLEQCEHGAELPVHPERLGCARAHDSVAGGIIVRFRISVGEWLRTGDSLSAALSWRTMRARSEAACTPRKTRMRTSTGVSSRRHHCGDLNR
jgi:hypothetical protein